MNISIDEYSKIYFNLPEEERDINNWVGVLEKYIANICYKYNNFLTFEERFQIAWVGACKAINTFDISKKYKFTTYLSVVIKNELLCNRRASICKLFLDTKNPNLGMYSVVSLSSFAQSKKDSTNPITIEDVIPDSKTNHISDDVMYKTDLEYLIQTCCEKDKKILRYLYEGYTQAEVASMLGCTQSCISRRIIRLRNRKISLFKEYKNN